MSARVIAALLGVVFLIGCGSKDRAPPPASASGAQIFASSVAPTGDSLGAASGAPVAKCTASTAITVDELDHDSIHVREVRLDGTPGRLIHSYAGRSELALDSSRTHAFGSNGYVDLASGEVRKVTNAAEYQQRYFLDDHTIVADVQRDTNGYPWTSMIEVRDVTTDALVDSFSGYQPEVAADGSVIFLRSAKPAKGADEGPPYIDVMRWTRRGARQLKRITMSEPGGPSVVTEAVPLPGGAYAVRVSDEHEHRYYDAQDSAFFPGLGHRIENDSGPVSKEQYNLTTSADGRTAAYTERTWNELTYLVVVDLVTRRRTQTAYYGSFPKIHGEHVVLTSDPQFVRGGDLKFRQIRNFALYAYHIPTGALCEVAKYPYLVVAR